MSRSKEMDLTTGNPFWSLLKFAIPVILGNLFQLFYTLADSVIVGKTLGADSLAAVGSTSIIIYFVFCFIKKYYDRIGRDYQALLRSVSRMADGDLDTEITEDLGIYEPMKVELSRVRDGFKKAVDEEVKSQLMKTDLITNVSHDLKTPLTAITTYVELLKKEDITEEERRSYIETLDKKSQRLKILIEDLFEVSKATSNNIVLHPMEVDVVNLLKQVAVEHTERFAAKGLTLRWDVPEEKVIVVLDNQKTFRIFENLFVNIQKYAMPQSRVYVQVHTSGEAPEKFVEITIKNMSATELNFDPEEITERFVRGDTSRGTEGSCSWSSRDQPRWRVSRISLMSASGSVMEREV